MRYEWLCSTVGNRMGRDVILHHVLGVTKGRTVGPTGVMGKKEEFYDIK
jgi:hypothetical protein